MRRIDELHLELPFAGSRMLRDLLRQESIEIGRQYVATLMKKMTIETIYCRQNTSKPVPGHKAHPYLLRKLQIVRPDQIWATGISYIPWPRGSSISWRLSTGSAARCPATGYRSRWKLTSASRRWRKRWCATAMH